MNTTKSNAQRNQFGKRLEQILLSANLKSSTVAAALNYDVSYISKWITGKALPSRKNVEKVLAVIGNAVAGQPNPSVRETLLESFGVSNTSDLQAAVVSDLQAAYYEVTGEINESQYASNASLRVSPSGTFPLLGDLASSLDPQKPMQIAVAADLFALDHALKLQLSGIESHRFRLQQVRKNLNIDYIIDLDSLDRTSAYDAILLIHMMTNFSLCSFRLYHSNLVKGKLLFSVQDEFASLSILADHRQFLCTTSARDKKSIDKSYRAIQNLVTPDDLVFFPADMEHMLASREYFHNLLSRNCCWLVGHMTEHFIPPALFSLLCAECFGVGSKSSREAERAYLLANNMIRTSQVRIMFYYLALLDFSLSGELDFFNHRIILSPAQRREVLAYFKSLVLDMNPENVKLVKEGFSDDFKYITNPCFFLSDFAPYLRLENKQYTDNLLLIKNDTAKEVFFSLFNLIWRSDSSVVISEHDEIVSKLDNILGIADLF